jgi:NAD(P)-dependent dehydrogenase (short-subunit alcohol dehydrogenase family)
MELSGRHVVVTGAASGIGRAMARRFAAEGARTVVVADRDTVGLDAVAAEIGGVAVPTDVSRESDIVALVERAIEVGGPVDLFCSNAGIAVGGGPETPNAAWEGIWNIHVMAHVWAARALLPGMLARGEGYLLNTASAAGLLTNLGALPYAVTKHAAVALAEWLSITYGDAGIRVSCLCPQGVRTPLLQSSMSDTSGAAVLAAGGLLDPEDVAEVVVAGLRDERFLILTHPEVATYLARKGADPERWLAGMRRLQARLVVPGTVVPGTGAHGTSDLA